MAVTAKELEGRPSGVDVTLIVENLRRTPTERLENMLAVLRFIEHVRAENGIRPLSDP